MISDMCKHTYLGKGLLAIVDAKLYLNEHDKFKFLPIGIHAVYFLLSIVDKCVTNQVPLFAMFQRKIQMHMVTDSASWAMSFINSVPIKSLLRWEG